MGEMLHVKTGDPSSRTRAWVDELNRRSVKTVRLLTAQLDTYFLSLLQSVAQSDLKLAPTQTSRPSRGQE